MPDLTAQEMAAKLQAGRFEHASPAVPTLSDPIADTPMVITLDQLRPYELDPRVTRNPRYEDIKASIRERGLDAPPTITRRSGESHFIIRNGGNTRLAILRELWTETRDEQFFRIHCLFRPWSARGEIIALTGHLAENELRGGLSFIERALGVEKARELYVQETGGSLTQTELARRLSGDGYPVAQPHVSRMQDAVRYLLPAIPSLLYAGLGRPQVERLVILRKAALRAWERRAPRVAPTTDFAALFQDVLGMFDGDLDAFDVQRVQDELVGQMAALLTESYGPLALEIVDPDALQRSLGSESVQSALALAESFSGRAAALDPRTNSARPSSPHLQQSQGQPPAKAATAPNSRAHDPQRGARAESFHEDGPAGAQMADAQMSERLQGHIVSPAETTDRLQAIQRIIAEATGEPLPDFQDNVVRALPVQAGGLYPISDVWYIEPALETPDTLRVHIAQLSGEIAAEAELAHHIESVDDGIGFVCTSAARPADSLTPVFARAVLSLLSALSAGYLPTPRAAIDGVRLVDDLGPLLQGRWPSRRAAQGATRLSDAGIVKLFRLIRLARRLVELESSVQPSADTKT